jgi:hypothetical protein
MRIWSQRLDDKGRVRKNLNSEVRGRDGLESIDKEREYKY